MDVFSLGQGFDPGPTAPGSVLASAVLVAGTTIGAGALALPSETAASGFAASSVAILGGWGYCIASGLLLAEACAATLRAGPKDGGVSVLSVTRDAFGDAGALAAGGLYTFLSYSLLVAYIAKGGATLSDLSGDLATAALGGPHAALPQH